MEALRLVSNREIAEDKLEQNDDHAKLGRLFHLQKTA